MAFAFFNNAGTSTFESGIYTTAARSSFTFSPNQPIPLPALNRAAFNLLSAIDSLILSSTLSHFKRTLFAQRFGLRTSINLAPLSGECGETSIARDHVQNDIMSVGENRTKYPLLFVRCRSLKAFGPVLS